MNPNYVIEMKINEKGLCRAFSIWRTVKIPLCHVFFVMAHDKGFFPYICSPKTQIQLALKTNFFSL
jgi:hypothetical protein